MGARQRGLCSTQAICCHREGHKSHLSHLQLQVIHHFLVILQFMLIPFPQVNFQSCKHCSPFCDAFAHPLPAGLWPEPGHPPWVKHPSSTSAGVHSPSTGAQLPPGPAWLPKYLTLVLANTCHRPPGFAQRGPRDPRLRRAPTAPSCRGEEALCRSHQLQEHFNSCRE